MLRQLASILAGKQLIVSPLIYVGPPLSYIMMISRIPGTMRWYFWGHLLLG